MWFLKEALLASTVLSGFALPAVAEVTKVGQNYNWTINYIDTIDAGACFATFQAGETQIIIASSYDTTDHEVMWSLVLFDGIGTWIKGKSHNLTVEVKNAQGKVKLWNGRFWGLDTGIISQHLSKEFVNGLAMDKIGGMFVIRDSKNKSIAREGSVWRLDNSAAAIKSVVQCLKAHEPTGAKGTSKTDEKEVSFGTGFVVAQRAGNNSFILTNNHVIKDCKSAPQVKYPGTPAQSAAIIAQDGTNDLALLNAKIDTRGAATFRLLPRLGEQVASFGFPYGVSMSTAGNFTIGNVTSLVGIGDDTRKFQLSAPLQPGNSGGPILDKSGRVIGISQMILGNLKIAEVAGAVPQNVNFAISASIAVNFLAINKVEPVIDSARNPPSFVELEALADYSKIFTVQVFCE